MLRPEWPYGILDRMFFRYLQTWVEMQVKDNNWRYRFKCRWKITLLIFIFSLIIMLIVLFILWQKWGLGFLPLHSSSYWNVSTINDVFHNFGLLHLNLHFCLHMIQGGMFPSLSSRLCYSFCPQKFIQSFMANLAGIENLTGIKYKNTKQISFTHCICKATR